jgi:hypothetical protein
VKDENTKIRWREYSGRLFSGGGGGENAMPEVDDSLDDTNRRFLRRIQVLEVKEAPLKRMKEGKAFGPDGIPIEVWRCLGKVVVVWVTNLFNHIFWSNKIPEKWREEYTCTYLQE